MKYCVSVAVILSCSRSSSQSGEWGVSLQHEWADQCYTCDEKVEPVLNNFTTIITGRHMYIYLKVVLTYDKCILNLESNQH